MPFGYIELGNYTNLGFGMGPPARPPPVRKMGHRHIEKGPAFHNAERYLTMRYAT